MSTIELVDPELADALALWPQVPLRAESLAQCRATALELLGAVPKPDLPDIVTDEIHVESALGQSSDRAWSAGPSGRQDLDAQQLAGFRFE